MNKKAQYLIEGITKDLMEGYNENMTWAIALFHNSETFEKLSNETSGLYIESSAYVYDILESEMKTRKIEQAV